MLKDLEDLSRFIGNTPLRRLNTANAHLYAKLEYNNFSGSSKDRAAYSMIYNAVRSGKINAETTVVASSSGNLAIALASICRILKVKFIPVIDPNINRDYEVLLNLMSYKVVKVGKRDKTGGYLLTRIDTVNEMCSRIDNSFCADQYGDPNNYKGYFGLGDEIQSSFSELDYVFIAVSSGGAITGISRCLKEKMPGVRIIAVDVQGSVIFGQIPEKRYISGIGSSQASPIMKNAMIDDVIHVSQSNIISGCYELLKEQVLFAGASSGAVYFAAKGYFEVNQFKDKPTGVLIFPDKGSAYLDTIYNKEWEKDLLAKLQQPV
jgi:2,3-diaminopropionate biosynthesis protein SbnA